MACRQGGCVGDPIAPCPQQVVADMVVCSFKSGEVLMQEGADGVAGPGAASKGCSFSPSCSLIFFLFRIRSFVPPTRPLLPELARGGDVDGWH